jgi:tetratricopeptide (TPR) repeat protein
VKRLALATVLLATALPVWAAHAGSTWSTGASDAEQAAKADDYDKAMSDGDDAALLAASESSNSERMKKLVLAAATDYERAAAARPDLAEPHWRAANVLYGFFLDCDHDAMWGASLCQNDDAGVLDKKLVRRIIRHWDAIERIDPLDPRIGSSHFGAGILFHRAILRTKLGTDADLTASIVDYESWLDRTDANDLNRPLMLGNLAEGYMMVGELEKAILTYRESLATLQETSIYYGLAVAYDRDGQGAKAREIIKALGESQFNDWYEGVIAKRTFYVPEGEVYYYLGLAHEALGQPKDAIASYRAFIDSGAHAMYQARAQENIDALNAKVGAAKAK